MCKPGRECLNCPYSDCMITTVKRVYPEETQMLSFAELPSSAKGKKKHRRTDPDGALEKKGVQRKQ